MGKITAPEQLDTHHEISNFDCGAPALNDWLINQALKNAVSGASKTYVVCDKQDVIGYYALATGSISRQQAPGSIRRKMPEPIPVIVLGRLAVGIHWQKEGVGSGLLKDAIARSLSVSQHVGVRALFVHALDEDAKEFYKHHGFKESPLDPMTLMLSLKV